MKKTLVIVLTILVAGCSTTPNDKEKTRKTVTSHEDKTDPAEDAEKMEVTAVDLVSELPEVQVLEKEIDSLSNGENHLTIWVYASPEETKLRHHWVKAGEDNGENVVTLQNYYVDARSGEILVYDVVNDTLWQLEDWRVRP